MGIFVGAQSVRDNSVARYNSMDLQLDSGSPYYDDSKEGLHFRYLRHFCFKRKATTAYVSINGISHAKNLLFIFQSYYN